jgi:hypothetical protein
MGGSEAGMERAVGLAGRCPFYIKSVGLGQMFAGFSLYLNAQAHEFGDPNGDRGRGVRERSLPRLTRRG